MNTQERIKQEVAAAPVVLYMKGTRQFPQCGFSALAVEILSKHLGTEKDAFLTVDVLLDEEVRQGIKEHSSWPTIPQLYIKGEFVGGADIIKQLHEEGELSKMLGAKAE